MWSEYGGKNPSVYETYVMQSMPQTPCFYASYERFSGTVATYHHCTRQCVTFQRQGPGK